MLLAEWKRLQEEWEAAKVAVDAMQEILEADTLSFLEGRGTRPTASQQAHLINLWQVESEARLALLRFISLLTTADTRLLYRKDGNYLADNSPS